MIVNVGQHVSCGVFQTCLFELLPLRRWMANLRGQGTERDTSQMLRAAGRNCKHPIFAIQGLRTKKNQGCPSGANSNGDKHSAHRRYIFDASVDASAILAASIVPEHRRRRAPMDLGGRPIVDVSKMYHGCIAIAV